MSTSDIELEQMMEDAGFNDNFKLQSSDFYNKDGIPVTYPDQTESESEEELPEIEEAKDEPKRKPKVLAPNPVDKYIAKRPLSSYPKEVLRELKLIAIDQEEIDNPSSPFVYKDPRYPGIAQPFGSYTYRSQRYPGDVDGMEVVSVCCTKENAANTYVKAIQRIVKDITSKRQHYYSETKAGINPLYSVSVGELKNGMYIPNQELFRVPVEYFQRGPITESEANVIKQVLSSPDNLNSNGYDIVEYIYRKYRILRWTAEEIKKGKMKLEDGSFISLLEAIQMDTMTKIDEIALVNGVFLEITNNWHLGWVDKDGHRHIFNADEGITSDLLYEIEKLYFSNMFYSPFKMVKRMYSYSRRMYIKTGNLKWTKYIMLIVPLLESDISAAYQMQSELSTLVQVLKLYQRPSPATINNELDNMKQRFASLIHIPLEVLSGLNGIIDSAIKTKNNKDKIVLIEKIIEMSRGYINTETIAYLSQKGLNPPPIDLLPRNRRYGKLIRQPTDEPVNPFEKELKEVKGSGCNTCGGCDTCGGDLTYGGCMNCRDNPQIQLANLIKGIY